MSDPICRFHLSFVSGALIGVLMKKQLDVFDKARFAGLIAVGYVLFFFGGIVVHYFISGDEYTFEYSLMLPSVWRTADNK